MAEEVEKTVKTSSDGTVKIAVERYQELLEKSAEKAPIVYNRTTKTPAVAASDNMMWGGTLMGLGGSLLVIGGIMFLVGKRQAGKL